MTTQDFKNKVEEIIGIAGVEEGRKNVLRNLLLALLANYLRLIAGNPKNQKILETISGKNTVSYENLQKAIDEAREKLKNEQDTVDFDALFIQAQNETLSAYVEELKKRLPAEKIEQIASILSS